MRIKIRFSGFEDERWLGPERDAIIKKKRGLTINKKTGST
jgi:hypothetical protein